MRKVEFENELSNEFLSLRKTAIKSRVFWAEWTERSFSVDLDAVVRNDRSTYILLIQIKRNSSEKHGKIQNSVRRYYRFVNGRECPRLKDLRGQVESRE